MHHEETVTVSGRVQHVFAHRFTVETETGVVLADLTPHGARAVALQPGEVVRLTGVRKPSEVKVATLTRGSQTYILPDEPGPRGGRHHGPHHRHGHGPHDRHGHHGHDAPDVDVAAITRQLAAQGHEIVGAPRLRHRHMEYLVRRDGALIELHVTFAGDIRKEKPADLDGKWANRDAA